jgi:hypothetical protein
MAIYFIEDRYLNKEGVELEGNGAGRCRAQPLRANPRGWRGGGEGGRTRRETEGEKGRGQGGGGGRSGEPPRTLSGGTPGGAARRLRRLLLFKCNRMAIGNGKS